MYDLPVGETPGWTQPFWFNFEVSTASIWNIPTTMVDRRNLNTYKYNAAFAQTSAIAEVGVAVLPWLAFSMEIPYAYRGTDVFSDFVEQFHWAVGSDTFERPNYPGFEDVYNIQTNGSNDLASDRGGQGVGNLKFKLKQWLWQWKGDDKGSCDCGLAVSEQVKVPTGVADQGLTSGSTDFSELVHLGIPLFKESGMWFTAAFTQVGPNANFAGWPLRRDLEMYELSSDWAINETWGILAEARYSSPILNEGQLSYEDPGVVDAEQFALDREASGWNSLVYWTGSETIGLRMRWGEGSQINFLFQEDFGIGSYDHRSDWVYCNNAPDFSFIFQFHFLL